MKFSITSVILLAVGSTHATYSGFIQARTDGECPKFIQSEATTDFTYDAATSNLCFDITSICPDGNCKLGMDGLWTGDDQIAPAKIAACPSSDCSQGCADWDVDTSSGIRVNCAEFTGQHYFYMGN